jgi:hypothetical protein
MALPALSPASMLGVRTFALVTVWQRLARVGRSSALIASASCVAALDSLTAHDVRSAMGRDGMNPTEMRPNEVRIALTRARAESDELNPERDRVRSFVAMPAIKLV